MVVGCILIGAVLGLIVSLVALILGASLWLAVSLYTLVGSATLLLLPLTLYLMGSFRRRSKIPASHAIYVPTRPYDLGRDIG